MTPPLWQEVKKNMIMASGPITSWKIDGETMETVTDFIFGGSKITADGDCSHEIKDACPLGKKSYDQPRQHIKKQRHYFTNKGLSSQSSGLSSSHVWMWELDIKKAECWRIDAFELWCWTRLLRIPWTARRSNLPILKEISPEYSLEGMMLKLKPQSFGHLMKRTDSLEKPWCWERLKVEGERTTEDEMVGWTWIWVNSGSWWWTGKPGVLWFMGSQTQTWLNNGTKA